MQKFLRALSFLFFLCLPAAAQTQQTIRVNAGGPAYHDTKGHAWSADYGFNTGSHSITAPKSTVTATSDPTLFKSARVGTSSGTQLQYQFKVTNGLYKVNLYFAETYFTKAKQRVFDVQMQGATLFSALDIFAQAGRNHALVKSAQVSVTNGQLVIRFVHHANANVPVISAVEILPSGTPPSITAQPASQSITVGHTATFKVVATGTAPLSYQWLKKGANIAGATSASYTTPAVTSADNGSTFQVKIKNSAGQVTSTTATLTVDPLLTVATTSLPGGTIGKSYSTTLQASSGTKPYSWSLSSGTLPAGLSLVASTGVISGKPTTTGIHNFTVKVTDATSSKPQTATKSLSITIAAVVTPLQFSTSSLSAGQVGVGLFEDDPGDWRNDAISLEYQLRGPARRSDAFRGDRNDLREADQVRFVHLHCQGYGFNFTYFSDSDEVVDHHGCFSCRAGTDHDNFRSLGASWRSLFDHLACDRRNCTVQVEHHFGVAARRRDARSGNRNDCGYTDDLGNPQLYNSCHRFGLTGNDGFREFQYHHSRSCRPFCDVEVDSKSLAGCHRI